MSHTSNSEMSPVCAANAQEQATSETVPSSADHDGQASAASAYTPLDVSKEEIRILIIDPNPDPEAVPSVSFKIVSLLEMPKFVALSYRWGESTLREPVLLNGQRKSITVSLGSALRQFRAEAGGASFELWADALCINQDDVEERNRQVKLMRKLYSQAVEVKIWLGPADAGTEVAFKCLQHILSREWQTSSIEPNAISFGALAILDSETGYKEVCNDLPTLASLFRNAYWTRRWTLQETMLAQHKTLHCGRWTEPWAFERILKIFVYLRELQARGSTDQAFWLAMGEIYPPIFTLLNKVGAGVDYKQFLLDTKTNECFLAHDIVYAVLGVLPPVLDIEVDYTKQLADVLADYVYQLMLNVDHLDILYQLRTTDAKLPSWIPELRAEVVKQDQRWFPIGDSPSHRSLQSHLYQCSASSTASLEWTKPNILSLKGFHLDTISAIGTVPRDSENTHLSNPQVIRTRLPDDWRNLYSSHCLPEPGGVTDEDIDDALFRIYHLDQMSGLAHEFALTQSRDRSARLSHVDIAACRDNVYADHPLGNPSLMTFFVTEKGRAGMTLSEANVGDCVFAIAGLDMPLCLRKVHSEGLPAWEKIAACYLHGVMDGEAVLDAAGGDKSRVQEVFKDISLV